MDSLLSVPWIIGILWGSIGFFAGYIVASRQARLEVTPLIKRLDALLEKLADG